jgi:hypothetical protein
MVLVFYLDNRICNINAVRSNSDDSGYLKTDVGGAGQERKGPMAMNGHAEGTQPQVRTSNISYD